MKMDKAKKREYLTLAEQHAEFLANAVFIPAFKMAFIHGAKHAFAEMSNKKKKGKSNAKL